MFPIGISGSRLLESWRIRGITESLLGVDSAVPLVHHDPVQVTLNQ